MSLIIKVRQQLKDLGFRPNLGSEIESLKVDLTVCQLVVVALSIFSIVFLLVPLFYLQNLRNMLIFFSISLFFLGVGVWFWVNRAEICEHPEEIQD